MKSNKNPESACLSHGLAALLAVSALATSVHATPYATSLTNNAGVISFRLNEDADIVRIISNGGATTNNLGPIAGGLTVTNLGVSGAFQVQVTKSSGPGYLQGIVNQISDDTNTAVQFINQRGVAVNRNPASPYFGRIYVSVATAGTTTTGRPVADGIYLLNADRTDAVGQGDTPRTGGLPFAAAANTESPYRLAVGADDNLYITDWSDATGGLYVTDPDVATNAAAINVLEGTDGPFPVTSSRIHGSIAAVYAQGSLAGGDLTIFTVDEDLQSDRDSTSRIEQNSIWRYDIGSGPLPFNDLPTKVASPGIAFAAQVADMTRGPDGKFYYSQRRADNATTTGVFVYSDDGSTLLWGSLAATRELADNSGAFDVLSESRGVAVSPDGRYLAVIKGNTNAVSILPLTNGVPNMTNRVVMPVTPTTGFGRALGFDAAGNLYAVSSGQQVLRVYSPGGFTVATTGSDGTFDVFTPQTDVSVNVLDDAAHETGPDTATFAITRLGDTAAPLTVLYSISGTASNGVDYVALPGSVVIAAGQTTTNITVTPINDSEAEFTETVILSITGSTNYTLGSPASGTAFISDNETPEITITVLQPTMYERIPEDRVTFRVTRKGETNSAVAPNINYTGTGVNGVDFNGDTSVLMDFGTVNATITATPVDNSLLDGNRTIVPTIASGAGYVVGTPASATATVIDDEVAPGTVVFSDSFESDTSANWTVRQGSGDGTDDSVVLFAYDYSADGIPAAPGSSTTLGLKLAANKLDGVASAAGVNVYPNGQSFSGDYALRFNMYAIVNSGGGTTEHSLFGINHSGAKANWINQSTANNALDTDGLWYAMVLDTSTVNNLGHVHYAGNGAGNTALVVSNRLASTLVNVFKTPPFYTAGAGSAGSPSNPAFSGTPTWVDVEVKKVGSLITCTINGTVVFETTNTTSFTSGNIMLGHNDQFNSIGIESATIFDNVRVVSLAVPSVSITAVRIVGGNVQVDFSAGSGDTVGSFQLHKASVVTGPYANDAGAVITQLSPGSFRATTAVSGSQQYFRIAR